MAPDGATYFPQPLRLRCQPIEDPEANICVGPDHSFIQLATLPPTSTVKAKSTPEEKKPMAGYGSAVLKLFTRPFILLKGLYYQTNRRSRNIQNQNLFCHFPQSCVAILLAHFLGYNLVGVRSNTTLSVIPVS